MFDINETFSHGPISPNDFAKQFSQFGIKELASDESSSCLNIRGTVNDDIVSIKFSFITGDKITVIARNVGNQLQIEEIEDDRRDITKGTGRKGNK